MGVYWPLNYPGNQVVGLGSGNELPKRNIFEIPKISTRESSKENNVYIKDSCLPSFLVGILDRVIGSTLMLG